MNGRALVVGVFVLSLACVAVTAQSSLPASTAAAPAAFDRTRFEISHTKFVLPNGLTVLVHEDRSVPIVAVNLWYHVGSRNEQRGRTGFAHLFEHFFFNGSEHHPGGFREAMDDLGATNRNGTTNFDRTNFFENVPTPALERTLFLEADRMGFLAKQINADMLERERGVVQNEKRQGENQPYGRVFDRVVERMYPASHPYSWSPIGSMADLQAATVADVQEWYRAYYGPNNCVLSLAGDISVERARELATKYFGDIPPVPPLARTDRWVPRLDANIREVMEDRVPRSRIYRIYHAPPWRDADVASLDLIASVLTGSRSARLTRRLVYDRSLASNVTAEMDASGIAGLFIITATVNAGVEPATVESELDHVLTEVIENGPTDPELQRARNRILSGFARRAEQLGGGGGRSDILAEAMTFAGDSHAYLTRLERVAHATTADVRTSARTWLDAPHYTLLVTPVAPLQPTSTSLDRRVVPPLGNPPEVSFPAVQRTTLSNGLTVLLLERHATPLVNVTLAIDAGHASDRPEQAGAASLALNLMDEGTVTRDPYQLADELDAIGGQIVTLSNLDQSLLRLQALAPNLRPSLDILADVVLNPSFPQDMVDLAKRQRIAQIAQEKAQPTGLAQRVVAPLLYGAGHAYGAPMTGSGYEETVNRLTRPDLVAWHRNWFHPNNATAIVVGDTTLAAIVPELERVFGSWRKGEAPRKEIRAAPAAPGQRVYLIDKPGAPQSVIVAAHVSETGGAAEDLAMETVMLNFGGMATSRLNRNLRLDKHWSYGTQGTLSAARGQRPFIVIAPVQTDKTSESIIEVQKELRDVAGARPIRGDEYASIMRTQTLGLAGRFATLVSLENAVAQLVNYKYADDYYATYATRVRTLSDTALAGAAKKYIRPDDVIWVVIGDLAQVEKGIRELKLGDVVRLDADGRPIGS
jgi:zinc protease